MKRITFLIRMNADRAGCIEAVRTLKGEFEAACAEYSVKNFSIWHMEQYLFGYGESDSEDLTCFDKVFAQLPKDAELVCGTGTMRQMYHDIGIVREDKSLIRHRVFATKLKPGCEEEYKRRHDGLIAQRGDTVKEGPESNSTIWYGDGHIFGYFELVRAFDGRMTIEEEHEASRPWETWQLEIMDWLTDDMNWLTGENHPPVERVI